MKLATVGVPIQMALNVLDADHKNILELVLTSRFPLEKQA